MANDILNIATRVRNAIQSDRPKRIATSTVLAKHKPRIFERGEAEDGSKIGTYSKKYGEKKTKLGRNPGFVNLRLSDQMYADYGLVQSGSEYGFGFQNQFNADKAGWAEAHFDKSIFSLSDAEFNLYVDVLLREQTNAF